MYRRRMEMEAGMDGLAGLMADIEKLGPVPGQFRGLLHILIGRRIEAPDGKLVSNGLTWRETAALLKRVRWDKDAVKELGLESKELPPRDRERYWYTAILNARVESDEARVAGDGLAQKLTAAGYRIGGTPK